ncbi:MAG TPA: IS3 family transposase [Candidatus Limnocylindrales bacterium]|nr:IS3 family transposase [Candidatus Limnocylindrales bacterium]
MIFQFIEVEKANYPITVLCKTMGVSRSRLHQWRAGGPSQHDLEDAYLTNEIVDIHAESRGSYGSPRVHAELRLGRSIGCGRKRVERLMKAVGLQGIHRRRLTSAASIAVAPDLLTEGDALKCMHSLPHSRSWQFRGKAAVHRRELA